MKHRTKAGELMEINEMGNEHLINTIGYMLKVLTEARKILDGVTGSKFKKVYFKRDESRDEQAEAYVESFDERLTPYIFEAWVRGLDIGDLRDKYQEITERGDDPMEKSEYFKAPTFRGILIHRGGQSEEMEPFEEWLDENF